MKFKVGDRILAYGDKGVISDRVINTTDIFAINFTNNYYKIGDRIYCGTELEIDNAYYRKLKWNKI